VSAVAALGGSLAECAHCMEFFGVFVASRNGDGARAATATSITATLPVPLSRGRVPLPLLAVWQWLAGVPLVLPGYYCQWHYLKVAAPAVDRGGTRVGRRINSVALQLQLPVVRRCGTGGAGPAVAVRHCHSL
jgi:hypothetical protein